MKSPDKVGQASEGAILAEFLNLGITTLMPFGYSHRYDFIIDVNNKFYRIQCKTGHHPLKDLGRLEFNTCSSNPTTWKKIDYVGQVEFFAVWDVTYNKAYLIPPEEVGKRRGVLRTELPKKNQKKKIRFAEDFELEKVIVALSSK